MEELLNIEDFSKDFEKRRLKKVYDKIIQKSYILIDKVAKKRGVHLLEREDDDISNFYSIISDFKSTTTYFNDVIFLMEAFLKWDINKDDPFGATKDKKIQSYIKLYNKIVLKLNYYKKIEKEIEKKGYEKARQEIENKFIELFKEMFKYKGKEYNENWSFANWVENISLYYEIFLYDLKELVEEVYGRGVLVNFTTEYQFVQSNDVEKIAKMTELYEDMLNYKKYE